MALYKRNGDSQNPDRWLRGSWKNQKMFIDTKATIPIENQSFQSFVKAFVFNCPSAIVVSKKKEKIKRFNPVSARECSFREREITGTLLITLTAQIKKQIDFYQKAEKNQRIEELFDSNFNNEKIVFKENAQMSDAEVIFYYIRNAFAHGSFEYIPEQNMYKLESKKGDNLKARMLLSEATLTKLAELSSIDKKSIEKLQKKRKGKKLPANKKSNRVPRTNKGR